MYALVKFSGSEIKYICSYLIMLFQSKTNYTYNNPHIIMTQEYYSETDIFLFSFTPLRMAIIRKQLKMLAMMQKEGNPYLLLIRMSISLASV